MHSRLPHIIHRQVFDLHLSNTHMEAGISERLIDAYYKTITHVEAVFSTFDDPERLMQIDRIFLDLGDLDLEKFEESFSARLCEALSVALRNATMAAQQQQQQNDSPEIPAASSHTAKAHGYQSATASVPEDLGRRSIARISTVPEGFGQGFLYFLVNGILPWWMSYSHDQTAPEETFEPVLASESPVFADRLRTLLSNNRNALKRLIYQFPATFKDRLVAVIAKDTTDKRLKLYATLKSFCSGARPGMIEEWELYATEHRLLEILVAQEKELIPLLSGHMSSWIREGVLSVDRLEQEITSNQSFPHRADIQEIIKAAGLVLPQAGIAIALPDSKPAVSPEVASVILQKKADVCANANEDERCPDDLPDGALHVSYAGLVILHPFLQPFFTALQLLDDRQQFVSEEARIRAIYLLACLAAGKHDTAESELPFCKYLCGASLTTAIPKIPALEPNEIEECELLLSGVIGHWTALKGTSSQGLREAFLSRRGKLNLKDDDPVLHVERAAYDILLEKLPWGIGFIQLPWLKKPLITAWN